jgi:hypothetical protein
LPAARQSPSLLVNHGNEAKNGIKKENNKKRMKKNENKKTENKE